jgi:polyvinyl alcohol dehydrogenase (cytochrome)
MKPMVRLMLAAVAALAPVVVAGVIPAQAAQPATCSPSWPQFSHDDRHSGAASACQGGENITASNASGLAPRWFVPTQGAVTAEPAVVGGTVYVGDSSGTFRAITAASGSMKWSFTSTDQHKTAFGEFPSSPEVVSLPGSSHALVFVGGGGTLYALDSVTGKKVWGTDVDPAQPTSAIEIESSPVVNLATSPPEVIVGSDDNGSPGIQVTGVQAFNAYTGALLWKYEPERDAVVHNLGDDGQGHACGDVWSSPALDSKAGLVVFGTGNCADQSAAIAGHDFATNSGIFALNATTGQRVWSFFEPPNQYDTGQPSESATGDDDFGSSAAIVHNVVLAGGKRTSLVIEASKSGYVYALDEQHGMQIWMDEPSQAGQLSPQLVGAIGGTIGALSIGQAAGKPAAFMTSAIPLPFAGPGLDLGATPPSATPDPSLATNPSRAVSLHAIDLATGAVIWQDALSAPSYAPTTYSGGVVFAPSTTAFGLTAYDANTGAPAWSVPLAAAASGGTSIVGPDVFLGTGTSFSSAGPLQVPPQAFGVWSFGLSRAAPPPTG